MELRFEVNKPTHFVFDHLSDMQKFCSIHPIIHKIEPKGGTNYLVHETLKVAFIPINFTYPVTVHGNAQERTITIKAKVAGGARVEMNFRILEVANHRSMVTELITFRSILPVQWMMKRIFREQHTRFFKNMCELKT